MADWRNDRIQQFTADGEWQMSFGQSGSGVGQFNRPNSVCVDEDGDIYVADWLNDRVQVFSPEGRFVTQMFGNNEMSQRAKDKLLANPDHIRQRALAYANNPGFEQHLCSPHGREDRYQQGRVCVLDPQRGRIQVYTKTHDPVLA